MDNQDTEDYEDFDGEGLEQAPQIQETPRPKVRKPKVTKKQIEAQPEEVIPEARYVAYHQEQTSGIVDGETNTVIGNDIYPILAEILNKLDNIEKSTG